MTDPIESIEDNYDDYFMQSAGWRYDAWDRFTPQDLGAYDEAMRSSDEDLMAWTPAVSWHRWFKVQVLMQRALYEQAVAAAAACVRDVQPGASPLLDVEDMARVALDVAMRHVREQVTLVASAWRGAKLEAKTELEGCLSWAQDGATLPLERWAAAQPDASEAYMDLAELMWRWGHPKDAAMWLDLARQHSAPKAPVRIDIELLQVRLQQLDEAPHL